MEPFIIDFGILTMFDSDIQNPTVYKRERLYLVLVVYQSSLAGANLTSKY